jgi:hypothetical protein
MGTTRGFSIRVESDLHGCEKCEKPANGGGLHAYTDKKPQADDEGRSDQHGDGNGDRRLRSDVEDDPTIPPILDRRGEACGHCGQAGGTEWDYDGIKVRLHAQCERAWVEGYEATHRAEPSSHERRGRGKSSTPRTSQSTRRSDNECER